MENVIPSCFSFSREKPLKGRILLGVLCQIAFTKAF